MAPRKSEELVKGAPALLGLSLGGIVSSGDDFGVLCTDFGVAKSRDVVSGVESPERARLEPPEHWELVLCTDICAASACYVDLFERSERMRNEKKERGAEKPKRLCGKGTQ